jgi:hypothetical protein
MPWASAPTAGRRRQQTESDASSTALGPPDVELERARAVLGVPRTPRCTQPALSAHARSTPTQWPPRSTSSAAAARDLAAAVDCTRSPPARGRRRATRRGAPGPALPTRARGRPPPAVALPANGPGQSRARNKQAGHIQHEPDRGVIATSCVAATSSLVSSALTAAAGRPRRHPTHKPDG